MNFTMTLPLMVNIVHIYQKPEKDGFERVYFVTEEGKFLATSINTDLSCK